MIGHHALAMVRLLLGFLLVFPASLASDDSCYDKFEYVFKVMQRLTDQETKITLLQKELESTKQKIRKLEEEDDDTHGNSQCSSSYIRWGRTECPQNATLVYAGYSAGGKYTDTGAAVDYLCLPTNPDWDSYEDGFQSYGRINGAEYETTFYAKLKSLHDKDVPCAMCRTSRAEVVMVPGKNVCYEGYTVEYRGYLMSGSYSHVAASQYVCVDGDPETLSGGDANQNGKLFYHVEAECGSLKCPPYVSGRELTCVVCSF